MSSTGIMQMRTSLFRTWLVAGLFVLCSVATFRITAQSNSNWTRSLAWNTDNTTVASGSQDGTIQIWNRVTNQLVVTLRQGNAGPVYSVAWSPAHSNILAAQYK